MMLESSDTKWLVLHKCIIKLIDNWDILKKYFISAAAESKSESTVTVSKLFNDDSINKTIKAYLLFLKYSLHFFNNLNDFYQSHRFLSHILLESSQQLICEVASNFMVSKALEDIVNINLSNHKNILNVNNIYVGPECNSFLRTLSPKRAREIRIQCRDFYAAAVCKMLECLPYKDTMFEQLMFLQPKIALYYEGRKKIRDLTYIAMCIGHPDITKLSYEWRILPTVYNDTEKEELAALEVDEMWKRILEYEDFNGDKTFPNLELLVESVFTFPHSNSEIKHIISTVTSIKCEEDDIQDSTRYDEVQDSTIHDEVQDSTRHDEVQDNTRYEVQDSIKYDEIQDSTRHDKIQDNTRHDVIQYVFIKEDPSE
ncbi:uncharacterized protein LOC116850681 isoform X3 [Odontomachus brunneus]|uniref:uncharacterized protein LOC116850681 isoform X3 n=1 Tax=Odontomachus brunneus TaxID=486640 RepID=UPI0013F21D85|nr:uncharacterized protein LOC116850681 isoform X3 [Odontomachus brunneus]XP_032685187.1 uncharacterized protein LOC116850681 isoform X3 [Odontomachus brunneus]XP_032685193.1 uncharacterized protein LOC116850681 isoform X3 [Odontomachus brunneus]